MSLPIPLDFALALTPVQVMGRTEDDELPVFGRGAASIVAAALAGAKADPPHLAPLNGFFSSMSSNDPYKHRMLQAMDVRVSDGSDKGGCDGVVVGPVMFVTRVEYANLFHTSTGANHRLGLLQQSAL
jgi:hypothetical protein